MNFGTSNTHETSETVFPLMYESIISLVATPFWTDTGGYGASGITVYKITVTGFYYTTASNVYPVQYLSSGY